MIQIKGTKKNRIIIVWCNSKLNNNYIQNKTYPDIDNCKYVTLTTSTSAYVK